MRENNKEFVQKKTSCVAKSIRILSFYHYKISADSLSGDTNVAAMGSDGNQGVLWEGLFPHRVLFHKDSCFKS